MKKITFLLSFVFALQANAQLEEGFDTAGLPTGWTESASSIYNWEIGATANNNSTVSPRSGAGMALFSAASYSGPTSRLETPSQDLTSLTSPMLTFYYTQVDWSGDQDELSVYFKDSATGTWTLISSYTSSVSSWTKVELSLPNPSADYYIGFEGLSGYGYGITLDDVSISEGPSCTAPSALSSASITATSAEISWTSDGTLFNIEYGPAGFTQGNGTSDTSTTASYSLSGLNSNSEYDVYVQTDCGSGETSDWISVSFSTLNSASCGETVTYTQVAYGDYSIILTGGNPAMVTVNGNLETSWSGCYDNIYVRDGSGNLINTVQSCGIFEDVTYTSTDGTISVQITNDSSTQYGDISLQFACEIPSCIKPTDLAVSDVTTDGATIAWTAGDTETDYEYVVQAAGTGEPTAAGTAVNGATTVSASGLFADTDYEVYVRSNCGSEFSLWTGPVSFTTLCSPFTAPYSQNFDTEIAPEIQNCWDAQVSGSTSSYSNVRSSTTESVSTLNSIRFYNSSDTTGDYFLVSPNFSDLDNTKRIRFSVFQDQGTMDDGDVLEIGTMTDPTDPATYTIFQTIPYTDRVEDTWVDLTVNFDSYAGTDNYIAIKMAFGGTYNYYYFDDFYYEEIPSCLEPTVLVVSDVTTDGATIAWTSDGTLFNIEYGPAGFTQGNGTSDTSATASYELTGLNSSSTYDVYVQTDCGATDGTSVWSSTSVSTLVTNDSCDTATVLDTLPFTSNGDATSATNNNGFVTVTDCGYGMNDGVWYTFTPTVSGTIDLVIDPTGWDPEIAVYNGSCGVFTCVDSADMGSSSESESLSIAVTAGTQYFVNLGDWSSSTDNSEGVYAFRATSTDASLGIEEASMEQFTYFPNPVNDVLTIKAQKTVEDITVFNMLGQVVKRQTPNTMDCTVDLSAMQSGAYFVQVSIDNTVETVRVLKK